MAETGALNVRSDPAGAFASASVAVLATASADAVPHVVPVVFALPPGRDDVVYTGVDAKPKTTTRLRRLTNIERNPAVSLLVQHYADDWTRLWWVRADGTATVHRSGPEMVSGQDVLREKYRQYDRVALDGPVIAVAIDRWTSWSGAATGADR